MSFFTPNTDDFDSFYEKRKFKLAWRLMAFFTSVFTLLSLVFLKSAVNEFIIYVICSVIGISSLIYLFISKKHLFIYYFLSIFGTLIVLYSLNNFESLVHFGDFLWIILLIVFSFFGIGIRYGLIILSVNLFTIIYYFIFNFNFNIAQIIPLTDTERVGITIEIIAATLSISYVIYQFVVFHNYSYKKILAANIDLQDSNTLISNQNNEKTTLVKEIHHRVKNNLQIVISLLRLQKGELKSIEAKKHFNEAINRIMVMSLIHKKLYQKAEMANIDIKLFVTDLANDVIHISNTGDPIKFNINSEIDKIGLKTIVPLGLLINELLSNTTKHAFLNEKEGFITINILEVDNTIFKLVYIDNGKWVEPHNVNTGFGLGLIQTLTEQLEGNFTRNESEYTFTIKNLDN